MLTPRHGRHRLARVLAAGLADTTAPTLHLPLNTEAWSTLPESRRRDLEQRAEALLDEHEFAVAFPAHDAVTAVATGLVAA